METLSFEAEPFVQHGCGCDACREVDEREMFGVPGLVVLYDYVLNPKPTTVTYGSASPRKGGVTDDRCGDGPPRKCPDILDLRSVTQVSGIGFDYIGGLPPIRKGMPSRKGIDYNKQLRRWEVVERHRDRNRVVKFRPPVGDALAGFLANMKAAGLEVEMLLSMGTLNCRCTSTGKSLSNHSFGNAIDIGGVRLVGGREILAANSECVPEDRRALHRINACLRLAFPLVYDYHDRMPAPTHWNHFHCDVNAEKGGERALFAAATTTNFKHWGFIREALGLPWKGGFDKACAAALRAYGGDDADNDAPAIRKTLGQLFMREALRNPPDRDPRYSCRHPTNNKAKPG